MTGKIQQPSRLNHGLPFLINAEWNSEQAWAVFELLDDPRDAIIWNHYAPDIQDLARDQHAPDHHHPAQQSR